MRYRRRPGLGSVPGRQHTRNPIRRLFAEPDFDQGSNDIPHHVMQEGISLDVDDDGVVVPGYFDMSHAPDRMSGSRR